ncbi:transposase [Streptomyces sp. NPDC014656]|uniref:transposase n=1 Tax=Streptomyces sp. NPDC014656 TaxID=3364878 RepID=UPI0036F71ADA
MKPGENAWAGAPQDGAWGRECTPFLRFDTELHRTVRTTNAIEPVNAPPCRAVETRGHFPDEQAALTPPRRRRTLRKGRGVATDRMAALAHNQRRQPTEVDHAFRTPMRCPYRTRNVALHGHATQGVAPDAFLREPHHSWAPVSTASSTPPHRRARSARPRCTPRGRPPTRRRRNRTLPCGPARTTADLLEPPR